MIKAINKLIFFFIISITTVYAEDNQLYHLKGRTMGTSYNIKYITDNKKLINLEEMQTKIDNILDEVNRQMSIFRKDSEITKFNDFREINKFMPIPNDFARVLLIAKEINQLTNGKFDVTIGPLVNLWGFGAKGKSGQIPSKNEIEKTKQKIGFDKLIIKKDQNGYSIAKKQPELYLDLGAIAKGFGADKVTELLDSLNIENYLVEIGGDLKTKGHNQQNKDWTIGIEEPRRGVDPSENEVISTISLHNLAITTSGNYRNFIEDKNKKVYSHEIDPATGASIDNNILSVSVIDKSTARSDALSTGIYLLGEKKGLELAEKMKIPVYLIIKDGDKEIVKMSTEFKKYLNK